MSEKSGIQAVGNYLMKISGQATLALFVCIALLFTFSQSAIAWQIQGAQIQGDADNSQLYSGVVYGPIDQNDTLWRIASRYKQDERFSVYQTMMAIYQLNPQAFENNNFNTMVNGATLRLPSDRYIARIDVSRARAKAENDDRAFGRPNSVRENVETAQNAENMKPDVPLVNQEDLSNTQAQLQRQLNSLRQQQQAQFQALKDQVSASINSVEVLLDENRKLNQQLLLIDENNRNLTNKVETELQTQIDQQVNQLGELIAIVKASEERRLAKESESFMQVLSSPTAVIVMMSSITILIIVALALFLLRRSGPAPASQETPIVNKEKTTNESDIVDDNLVIGEMDEELDKDSDDLLAALSEDQDMEDDDILSDDLEDEDALANLDDDLLSSELDDMLVPDSDDDLQLDDAEKAGNETQNVEENFDLDELDLESDDAISLDDDEISLDDDADEQNTEVDLLEDEAVEQVAEIPDLPPESEEIEEDDGTPPGIDLDEHGEIDDNTLEQIGSQIEEKDNTISRMADEILDELDKVPSDSADIDELSATEQDISSELESDNLADTDESSNAIPEDLISEESQTEAGDLDESQNETASIEEEPSVSSSELTGSTDTDEPNKAEDLSEDADDIAEQDLKDDQLTALADDILQDLESDDSQSDELDELLEQMDDDDISDAVSASDKVSLDADELLDGIPSFTSDNLLSDDDSSTQDELHDKDSDKSVKDEQPEPNPESNPEPKINQSETSAESDEESADEESAEEEDVLASLPDLDNWLDEDTPLDKEGEKLASDLEEISSKEDTDDELDLSALDIDLDDFDSLASDDKLPPGADESELMQELDDSSFDDMLSDLESSDQSDTDADSSTAPKTPIDESTPSEATTSEDKDVIKEAGLDLESLLQDDKEKGEEQTVSPDSKESFVDVDDLIKESDALPQMSDDEKALDLGASLNLDDDEATSSSLGLDSSLEPDQQQASNLDLAQVYIDMEDKEAAKELLLEVANKGNEEQQEEAKALLISIT